ncbi:ectoine hydroxylase [soil metagenome]
MSIDTRDGPAATRGGDRYPSRVGTDPTLTERKDPVMWGARKGGVLDPAQFDGYQRDGYLQIPSLLTPDEVAALDAEVDRLATDAEVRDAERTIVEPDAGEVRSVFEVHHDGPFADLCRDQRLAGVARQLLGSDVYIHQSRINLKPGFRGKEFYWHSDFETWHTEDGMGAMRAVSASVSLTENVHVNGPLMVIAGSHRFFVSCPGETPPDHHKASLRRQEIGVPDDDHLAELTRRGEIRDLVGPAGSVTFFECNMMHGSNGNITPLPRRNAFFVYNSVENPLVDPFSAPAPRPTYIAGRDFTPLPR